MIDITNIQKKLDLIVSAIGLIIGGIFLVLGFYIAKVLFIFGILFLLSCAIYILIYNKVINVPEQLIVNNPECHISNFVLYILYILFLILFVYGLYTVKLSLYSRPIEYFISVILLTIIVAILIFIMPKGLLSIWLILLGIFALGLSLRSSVYYEFSGYVGADPWYHDYLICLLLNLGHVAPPTPDIYSPETSYAYYPIFHVLCAQTSLLSGLDVTNSMFASISVIELLSLLFIFLLGIYFFNQRIGLLMVLLLCINYHHVRWGFWIIAMTLGLSLTPFLVYLINVTKIRSIIRNTFILLIGAILIQTHTLSSLIALLILVFLYISSIMYGFMYARTQKSLISLSLIATFFTFMLTYWTYVSDFFEISIANFIRRSFRMEFLLDQSNVEQPIVGELINNVTFLIIFFLAIIGSLYIINKANIRYQGPFIILMAGWLLALTVFFLQLFKISTALPTRWYSFVELLLIMPMSIGVCLLSWHKNAQRSLIMFLFVILVYSGCMFFNSTVNPDGTMQSIIPTNIRSALTESEIKSAVTILENYEGTIGSDAYMGYLLELQNESRFVSITSNFMNKTYTDIPTEIILVRKYTLENPHYGYWANFRGVTEFEHDVLGDLDRLKYNHMYNCGSVYGFHNTF